MRFCARIILPGIGIVLRVRSFLHAGLWLWVCTVCAVSISRGTSISRGGLILRRDLRRDLSSGLSSGGWIAGCSCIDWIGRRRTSCTR